MRLNDTRRNEPHPTPSHPHFFPASRCLHTYAASWMACTQLYQKAAGHWGLPAVRRMRLLVRVVLLLKQLMATSTTRTRPLCQPWVVVVVSPPTHLPSTLQALIQTVAPTSLHSLPCALSDWSRHTQRVHQGHAVQAQVRQCARLQRHRVQFLRWWLNQPHQLNSRNRSRRSRTRLDVVVHLVVAVVVVRCRCRWWLRRVARWCST